MIQHRTFSPDAQAYLDGDTDHLSDEHARTAAERFSLAVTQYNDGLEVPGREVDRAVMAVLREQHDRLRGRGIGNVSPASLIPP
ncbi:MAG: hypothetical protein IIA27_17160 [Gemmatimonadetes bacterium]|nr:hypothetical protein [Gemmatimonadota bacterium]